MEAVVHYEFVNGNILSKALEAAGATIASHDNEHLALTGDVSPRFVLYEVS